MKVRFDLAHTESGETIYSSKSLLDVVDYARKNINDYRNYSIHEVEGKEDIVAFCSLFWLIEVYKGKIPVCITDLVF